MSLLNQNVCLVLNAAWQAIGVRTPEEAFTNLANGTQLGMVIEGDQMYPVDWDTWITLKPLNKEFTVRTAKLEIRIPTVIIAKNFNKMPMKTPALTKGNIARRDKFTCQYTHRKLKMNEISLDHIIPKSRGGKNTWVNLVTAAKEINFKKGNLTPQEAGLPTPRTSEPRTIPVSLTIQNAHQIKDWDHFLISK